jgi:spermidine synthase
MSEITITDDSGQGKVLRRDGEPIMSESTGYFHRMIGATKAHGRVLDIGTGMAQFLIMADKNPNVESIDTLDISGSIHGWVKDNVQTKKPVEYITSSIGDYINSSEEKYDFIFLDYLWGNALQVDEAIEETKRIIEWAKDHLNPGGQIVLWYEEVRWYRESVPELEKYFDKTTTQDHWNPHSMTGFFETDVWTLR